METISLSILDGRKFFTSGMPDVEIAGTDGTSQQVTVSSGDETLLDVELWPSGGIITLAELGEMLEPLARQQLVCSITISAGDTSATFQLLYAMVDVGVDADTFYGKYFLTLLTGAKKTARGRRELLWYYGSDSATATAEYADGTTGTFSVPTASSSSAYTCLNVSPDNFTASDKTLVAYTIVAGQRSQRFEMDFSEPDCAPILEFINSFGVWEYIYCTGTHEVSSDYKRSTTRIRGKLCNYKIEETRVFKGDTGILSRPMADWAHDLFRSDEVYVVNVIDGAVQDSDGGKLVVVTDSKDTITNDDDNLPRFTFSYQYGQRIQATLQTDRVGRIFDNTFDHTFN